MKFIGGEELSPEEKGRMIDAELQRRRIRHALRPRTEIIKAIIRIRRRFNLPTPADDPVQVQTTNNTELANILVELEDRTAGFKESTETA